MVGTICSPPSGCTRKHPPVTSNPLDEKAGLGLPEGFKRLLEVAISSTQGLKPPSWLRQRLQVYVVTIEIYVAVVGTPCGVRTLLSRQVCAPVQPRWAPLMFEVHDLLNLAINLIVVPPSLPASHTLLPLSHDLSMTPNLTRVLYVLKHILTSPCKYHTCNKKSSLTMTFWQLESAPADRTCSRAAHSFEPLTPLTRLNSSNRLRASPREP
jgi:hypothetical protein